MRFTLPKKVEESGSLKSIYKITLIRISNKKNDRVMRRYLDFWHEFTLHCLSYFLKEMKECQLILRLANISLRTDRRILVNNLHSENATQSSQETRRIWLTNIEGRGTFRVVSRVCISGKPEGILVITHGCSARSDTPTIRIRNVSVGRCHTYLMPAAAGWLPSLQHRFFHRISMLFPSISPSKPFPPMCPTTHRQTKNKRRRDKNFS